MLNIGDKIIYIDAALNSDGKEISVRGVVTDANSTEWKIHSNTIIYFVKWENGRTLSYSTETLEKLMGEGSIKKDLESIRDDKLKQLLDLLPN